MLEKCQNEIQDRLICHFEDKCVGDTFESPTFCLQHQLVTNIYVAFIFSHSCLYLIREDFKMTLREQLVIVVAVIPMMLGSVFAALSIRFIVKLALI